MKKNGNISDKRLKMKKSKRKRLHVPNVILHKLEQQNRDMELEKV